MLRLWIVSLRVVHRLVPQQLANHHTVLVDHDALRLVLIRNVITVARRFALCRRLQREGTCYLQCVLPCDVTFLCTYPSSTAVVDMVRLIHWAAVISRHQVLEIPVVVIPLNTHIVPVAASVAVRVTVVPVRSPFRGGP